MTDDQNLPRDGLDRGKATEGAAVGLVADEPASVTARVPAPAAQAALGQGNRVGVVGSPSSTSEITVDILADASAVPLLGDLVYLSHPIADGRHLIALGTVAEIETTNRWHEDPNMRGVLKLHGSLPHLSGDGDVRTAQVFVQAAYDASDADPPFADAPREAGGALSMSPTTGQPVERVSDDVVQALIARHAAQVVYMGHIYRTGVRLPLFVRDYDTTSPDGAFHTGIFGRTASGKTALATYLMACQMRHEGLSILVFDPQGQFASQRKLPFDLQAWARLLGRRVTVVSIAEQIRLPAYATLFIDILANTGFLRFLTITRKDNREAAVDEFVRILRGLGGWESQAAPDLLTALLTALSQDTQALQRIFTSAGPQNRLLNTLGTTLANRAQLEVALGYFAPIHSLFSPSAPDGAPRTPLTEILDRVLDPLQVPKPFVIVDLTRRATAGPLESTEVKARLMRTIARELELRAERAWEGNRNLNCAVYLDEAQYFASARPEGDEAEHLAARLVDYVRTTRKYGLGWTFITQEIGSLRRGIYDQLRVRAFGYGLTSGSDLSRLQDEIGRGAALDLYKSFVDPSAVAGQQYPFMLTGPISPLSFTAAPVFLSVYTDRDRFVADNGPAFRPGTRVHRPGPTGPARISPRAYDEL